MKGIIAVDLEVGIIQRCDLRCGLFKQFRSGAVEPEILSLQYLMGHSDIGVTMNTYTHLGLEDAKEEMIRMEELNAARAELNKTTGEKPVTQKMFRAV